MSNISQADFYFGSALSVLFNKNMKPALVENGTNRRIYDLATNSGDFKLFMKYRTKPTTDNNEFTSWQFQFNNDEIEELRNNLRASVLLVLICGKEALKNSQFAVLNNSEIRQAICESGKNSITIGRRKHAKNFYITMPGGRINDILIRANKLDL